MIKIKILVKKPTVVGSKINAATFLITRDNLKHLGLKLAIEGINLM